MPVVGPNSTRVASPGGVAVDAGSAGHREVLAGRWPVQELGGDGALLEPDYFGAVRQCLGAVDDHAGAALIPGLLAVGEAQVVKGQLVAEPEPRLRVGLGVEVKDFERAEVHREDQRPGLGGGRAGGR